MAATWRLIFLTIFQNSLEKAILVLLVLINRSYFQLNALKPGIYRITASVEGHFSACTVFLVILYGGQLR